MPDSRPRYEMPPPGGIAWLDVSAEATDSWPTRVRTGPLGLQISPLNHARAPYLFKGARLRGTRCMFSAATLSGAELFRPPRPSVPSAERSVQVLIRSEGPGSVFDADTAFAHGTLRVIDPTHEICELFHANSMLSTLNVHQAAVGIEAASVAEMYHQVYALTPFQTHLLRSAVSLLASGTDELSSTSSRVGIDRFLSALTGLLLRTVVRAPLAERERMHSVRGRTETIIFEQAADPLLTPVMIAGELNISLRQLYRAFTGTESPAARIRRRRLERAAELLATSHAQAQVEDVAQDCGFASAEYFSRAFRREFGLSPRAYRAAYRDGAATH